MQIQAIKNQQYVTPFTSKVIVPPNTMYHLTQFMQDNPPGAKSIISGLRALEKNGKDDVVMVEKAHSDTNVFVMWVYEKVKNKLLRSKNSYPIDVSLYTFKANVQQCYEKAKLNMTDLKTINKEGLDIFNPLK